MQNTYKTDNQAHPSRELVCAYQNKDGNEVFIVTAESLTGKQVTIENGVLPPRNYIYRMYTGLAHDPKEILCNHDEREDLGPEPKSAVHFTGVNKLDSVKVAFHNLTVRRELVRTKDTSENWAHVSVVVGEDLGCEIACQKTISVQRLFRLSHDEIKPSVTERLQINPNVRARY